MNRLNEDWKHGVGPKPEVGNWVRCSCSCHRNAGVKHVIACCEHGWIEEISLPAPPSSPTATAESNEFTEYKALILAMEKEIIKYRGWQDEDAIPPINPLVELKILIKNKQEARRQAIQECIELMNALISKMFGLTVNNQLYYLDSDEVLKELEKLKLK